MPGARERVAVVTGASRGIGRAAALALAETGAHIVAVARTVGGLEELDDEIRRHGGSATLVPLDLADHAAIDRLGGAIYERWGRLDILLANAGILGALTPLAHLEPKVWDQVMAVNVTANWRLIRSLDALLRQSEAGRALFVSSGGAATTAPYWGVYATSKAALERMVLIYAAELRTSRATANILRPDIVRTRMREQAFPGEDPKTLPPPETIAPHIVALLEAERTDNGRIFDIRSGRLTIA